MPFRAVALPLLLAAPLAAGAAQPTARATLKTADGREVGTSTFTERKGGVRVALRVAGLPPGSHGVHVHAAARCEPPDFKSAGGHFNPTGRKHGLHSAEGAHAGDLPNLAVKADGTASLTFTLRGATLGAGDGSLFGPEGTALVVHADADDGTTDPAGNSGARIACGVIERR